METHVRRMPIGMLDHLQHICARQDQQFIGDVARILGLSASTTHELRRKILGTLGTPTIVATESNPWWVGTQCPVMFQACASGMWSRCGNMCTPDGKCWKHRTSKKPLYNDPEFTDIEHRTPFRVDKEIYWIGKDGCVYDSAGTHLKDVKVNLKSRILINLKEKNGASMGINKSECVTHTEHESISEQVVKMETKTDTVDTTVQTTE
jgi:ligand-binding SRPBCC domain-containing protein